MKRSSCKHEFSDVEVSTHAGLRTFKSTRLAVRNGAVWIGGAHLFSAGIWLATASRCVDCGTSLTWKPNHERSGAW